MLRKVQAGRGEAARWLARLHADDRSPADEKEFRAWLAADPDNVRQFELISSVWESVGSLRHELVREEVAAASLRQRPAGVSRRSVLGGSLAAALAGGSFLAWSTAMAGVIETEVGEQRRVTLEDGTRLMLDTDTRIKVRFNDQARLIELQRGRVSLDIAQESRPFVVETEARRFIYSRGQFDVRQDDGLVSLIALDGRATIEDALASEAPAFLEAGQRLQLPIGQQAVIDRPSLEDATAWKLGRAVFRDESLETAIAEMNRYSKKRLVLADEEVGKLRISGVYRVGDNAAFARSLSVLLSVRAHIEEESIFLSLG